MTALRVIVPEVGPILAFFEVGEHIIDVIDSHIHCHN